MNQEMKLAVLIDAENISSKYIDVILSEANNLGDVIYKRIYGNWTTPQMASWRNTILDNAIQPVQQYSNTIRKIRRTRPSSSTRWIYCTRAISTASASFRQTAISPAWPRACGNRRNTSWAWAKARHPGPSSRPATSSSTSMSFGKKQKNMKGKPRKMTPMKKHRLRKRTVINRKSRNTGSPSGRTGSQPYADTAGNSVSPRQDAGQRFLDDPPGFDQIDGRKLR